MHSFTRCLAAALTLTVLTVFSLASSAQERGLDSGDFVSRGCSNYVFVASTNDQPQKFMVLMMPPAQAKYDAHIHVHAMAGTPTVSIMGMDESGYKKILLADTMLNASSSYIDDTDTDININQGMDNLSLPPGKMVMLNVSASATVWVFVDRCLSH